MGQITRDQSLAVVSILMTNIDWDAVDFEKAGLQDSIILDQKGAGARLTAFLQNGTRFVLHTFPTWKTVTIGTHKSVSELRTALGNAGFKIGSYASRLLDKVTVAPKETALELVNVSVGELGFPKGATRADIYKRASEFGLDPVPAEVGSQLRLQYEGQPVEEWVLMAMEPIAGKGGFLSVFSVEHDGVGRWLNTRYSIPADFWFAGSRWVFVRRN